MIYFRHYEMGTFFLRTLDITAVPQWHIKISPISYKKQLSYSDSYCELNIRSLALEVITGVHRGS